jgi:general stress protein CsbA
MRSPIPDRFSLWPALRDYLRLVRKYKSSKRDWWALIVLFGLPLALLGVSARQSYVFPAPVAMLPAVSLLAGVLLSAAGQVITLRARIADSLTLSTDDRVRSHVRETMSGVVLAASAALGDALLFGALGAATQQAGYQKHWWHVALSSAALAMTTYLALMFIATARRLYATYLEVFENGAPVRAKPITQQARERSAK